MPPIIEWLDENEPKQSQAMPRVRRSESAESIAQFEYMGSDSDASGFEVYMEAVKLAVMGQGKPDAACVMWVTLDAVRGEFDRMYQRNAEANRKAFERAHKRAVGEGKVAVRAVDHGRQLVRIVELSHRY